MPAILLVEDDPAVRAALTRPLLAHRFQVRAAPTAAEALRAVTSGDLSLVILDLGLPDLDGSAALRMIRAISDVPVIVATARGSEESVVAMLNDGADDYVVKPFSGAQLVARICALLRRTAPADVRDPLVEIGELRIDTASRTTTMGGSPLQLTRKEFDLLAYLALHAGQVVTRQAICRHVWGTAPIGLDQTIDVHVSWLRRKLGESAARPRYLHTVRGVGLKLSAPT